MSPPDEQHRQKSLHFLSEIEEITAQLEAKKKLVFGLDNFDLLDELIQLANNLAIIHQTLEEPNENDEEEAKGIWRKQIRSLAVIKEQLKSIVSAKRIKQYSINALDKLIDDYNEIERIKEKVNNVKWYRGMYEYGAYAGIGIKFLALVWLGIKITFEQATLVVGVAFPPLIYGFLALRALVDTSAKAYLVKANKQTLIDALKQNQKTYDRIASGSSQLMRALAAATAFLFNSLAAISFAAVLAGTAFPIFPAWFATAAAAWAFVSIATVAGWVSDSYVPTRRLEGNYNLMQRQLEKLDKSITELQIKRSSEPDENKINKIDAQLATMEIEKTELKRTFEKAKKDFLNKNAENTWGFSGAISTVFTACAPLPFVGPFIAILGYAIMGVVGIRGAAVAAASYLPGSKIAKSTIAAGLTEHLSSTKPNKEHSMVHTAGLVQRRLSEMDISSAPLVNPDIETLKSATEASKKSIRQTNFHLSKIHYVDSIHESPKVREGVKKPSFPRRKGG